MPELPISQPQLGNRIGFGYFKNVFEHPDNPEKIVKEHKEHIPQKDRHLCHLLLGMEFYLTKILSLLYPGQISDIHMAHMNEEGIMQTIHDKQQVDNIILNAIRFFLDTVTYTNHTTKRSNRYTVSERFKKAGVIIDDQVVNNFGTNQEGAPIFIDSPYKSSLPTIINTNRLLLMQAIQALPDTDHRKKTCTAFFDRFDTLMNMYKEETMEGWRRDKEDTV